MKLKWWIKLRIIFWLILLIIIGVLAYYKIVPSGKITYVYNFKKDSRFIGKLTPAERLENVKNGEAKIIADPVYFSLFTPRKFDSAKLTITYKNESQLPIIEAGVLADKIVWRYDLEPIDNKILDQLALVWPVVKNSNSVLLLQRNGKYKTLDDFLKNPPANSEIAIYNYELKNNYALPDYKPTVKENILPYALRGDYKFYTYIKNEDLDFSFSFTDLNKNKQPDPIDLNLYKDNKLIDSWHFDDIGFATDDGIAVNRGEINLLEKNLPEGVYKIELRANDDVITNKITYKQSKLAFINKLWLADNNKKDISLLTDGKIINTQTINPAKLQTVKINGQDFNIAETYRQYSFIADKNFNFINLAKDDITLSANGVFSFSQESLIDPDFKKVDASLDIKNSGINYIITKYDLPSNQDDWLTASAEYDISNSYRENNKFSFIISIPGLKADDQINDSILIKEIKVELSGKNFWRKIREMISNK